MNLVDKNLPDYCLDFYGLLVNIFAFIVNKIVFSQIKSYSHRDGKTNSILWKHFNGVAIKSYLFAYRNIRRSLIIATRFYFQGYLFFFKGN